jgi:hypothetical protein
MHHVVVSKRILGTNPDLLMQANACESTKVAETPFVLIETYDERYELKVNRFFIYISHFEKSPNHQIPKIFSESSTWLLL